MGYNETALELLTSDDYETKLAKSQIYVNMGKTEEAIALLDSVPQDTPIRKF